MSGPRTWQRLLYPKPLVTVHPIHGGEVSLSLSRGNSEEELSDPRPLQWGPQRGLWICSRRMVAALVQTELSPRTWCRNQEPVTAAGQAVAYRRVWGLCGTCLERVLV